MSGLRIALRADASTQIGSGHVSRCLALAQALREVGADVCLVSRKLGVDTEAMARSVGVVHHALPKPHAPYVADETTVPHAEWAQVPWALDAEQTSATLRDLGVDRIVVDHYSFDARWHHAIREAFTVSIAAIDDLADRMFGVDWLIDHNFSPDPQAKYAGRLPAAARLLAGPRFALIAPAYEHARRCEPAPQVGSIGIFLGGADAAGLSARVLQACREQAGFTGGIEIATTSANPRLDALRQACARWPRTTLTIDEPNLVAFFGRHGLQIGAGGGATWERCCIGAPTLALIAAPNQRTVISELARLRVLATPEPAEALDAPAIGHAVAALLADPRRRLSMAKAARRLVDGLGARRVALALTASMLTVRRARLDDGPLIHGWRNALATRVTSHDPKEIMLDDHLRWLARTLQDPQRALLMATVGAIPVGVIRCDAQPDGVALVSLYLDPDLHGLGLGAAMLREGERFARGGGLARGGFEATVLDTNTASKRLFTSAGYVRNGGRWVKRHPATAAGESSP